MKLHLYLEHVSVFRESESHLYINEPVNLPIGVALVVLTVLSVNCAPFDGPELKVDALDWSLELAGCLVTGAGFVTALVVTTKFGSCVG